MRKYFCGCGKPIDEIETNCISCQIEYENRYRDYGSDDLILTDELKKKYIGNGGERNEE